MQSDYARAHSAYAQGQVAASSPLRIVVLLYEGAIRFCRQAQQSFADPAIRGHGLGRVHAIVSELMIALDHEKGGEIASRLESLYRYVLDALIRANVKGDPRALDSAIGVLEDLAAGWREIAQTGAGEAAP
jgi:flagellar secretion chaperone FliS